MPPKQKLLAIDARPLTRGNGGIQRYLQRLLPHITKSNEFDVVLYSDEPICKKILSGLEVKRVRSLGKGRISILTWQVAVPAWIKMDAIDIYWSPRHHLPLFMLRRHKRVVTIHDFVWKRSAETMPCLQYHSERLLMPSSLSKADEIICISKTTQKQLGQYFPKDVTKSSVILHGVDCERSIQLSQGNVSPGYFLSIGTLEPRKNYGRLIRSFNRYIESGGNRNLILVGKEGWHFKHIYKQLGKIESKDRVQILTNVTDQELRSLYAHAQGFISVSLDEGFGLPPQEACQYGLPLMLSEIDVYCELYPHAEVWVDPLSEEQISNGLSKLDLLMPNSSRASKLREDTWSDCADKLITSFIR